VPEPDRPKRLQRWRRAWLVAQLQRRRVQIALLIVLNVLIALLPWWMGLHSLTVLALLPLVSVPLVGALAYWITWGEFHR
jgi:uncharacterized membrane protein